MSALDIDWLRPVTPDGLKPLQILIDWFAHNGVVYHASTHQREVLGPLCRELNARGLQCEVDQILDYVSYLQEVVHDAAALHRDLPESLKPYQDRLQELLFKDGHTEAAVVQSQQQKARHRSSSRLSWLEPSPYCGPSGMEVLVEWLKSNYTAYAHATKKGEKGKMLEELVKEMKGAGIQDCAVNTVRAKIDVLHREVRGEKTRSAAWEQFGSVLEEIFTVGDAGECEDSRNEVESSDSQENGNLDYGGAQDYTMEDHDRQSSNAIQEPAAQSNNDTQGMGESNTNNGMKIPVKHTRSSPTSRLSWMKPASPGSPSAMELLVEWMERHYAAYTQSTKKGDKGKMLAKLLHKIEDVGHRGCTIHAIRVKIDSLQRQAGGKARPSSAFDQYGASLRKVFAERDGVDIIEPRVLSPPSTVGRQDEEESHNSEGEDAGGDESPEELVLTADNTNPEYQNALVDRVTTEQTAMHDIESRDDEVDANTFEANSSPNHLPTSSDSETEEEEDKPAKKKPIASQVRRWPSSPAQSPSTSEIVRIATLLRERHDLHQRGVPQDQIDKFLPLPNVQSGLIFVAFPISYLRLHWILWAVLWPATCTQLRTMASRHAYNLRDEVVQPLNPSRSTPWSIVMARLQVLHERDDYNRATDDDDIVQVLWKELGDRGFRCRSDIILTKLNWLRQAFMTPIEQPDAAISLYDNMVLVLTTQMMEMAWENFDVLVELLFDDNEREILRQKPEIEERELDAKRERDASIVAFYRCGGGVEDVEVERDSFDQRVKWNNSVQPGGPSPVKLLEDWISVHYEVYSALDAEDQRLMLTDLREKIKNTGHTNCTEGKLRHKIIDMIREIDQEVEGCKWLIVGDNDYCLPETRVRS